MIARQAAAGIFIAVGFIGLMQGYEKFAILLGLIALAIAAGAADDHY